MGNPFAIDNQNYYTAGLGATNPYISGGAAGGVQAPRETTPAVQGKETGFNPRAEIDEVGIIGANKRAGFENGLGGTNNPDDHKIFYAA